MKLKKPTYAVTLLPKRAWSYLTSSRRNATLFAIAFVLTGGAIFLLVSHALSPATSLEPEQGNVKPPAVVGSDSNASNGGFVQFGTGNVKPQLAGVINRQGQPSSSSYYPTPVSGFVVKTTWAALQPSQGGGIAPNNAIDAAIDSVHGTNAHIKLRVYTDFDAPDWAKNLPVTTGQQGPFTICNSFVTPQQCGSVGHFWEVNFRQAYADFQSKLAAKYDTVPEIEEVVICGCSTNFDEPLLRQVTGTDATTNTAAYIAAGYSEVANEACEHDQIVAHNVWTHTRSTFAFNPYEQYDAASSKFVVNEDYTERLIDDCRQTLGPRCVLGNNSIGKRDLTYPCSTIGNSTWGSLDKYARMYTKISCAGAPIYFQTDTSAAIAKANNTLDGTLSWAISVGVGMVELPAGYDKSTSTVYILPAALAVYDQGLSSHALP